MGNKSSRAEEQTDMNKIESNIGEDSQIVKNMRKLSRKQSLKIKDDVYGFDRFVPILSDQIENSTIMNRRKDKSEKLSSQSTSCADSSTKALSSNKKKLRGSKKIGRSVGINDMFYVSNLYSVEEITSPSLHNEINDMKSTQPFSSFKF